MGYLNQILHLGFRYLFRRGVGKILRAGETNTNKECPSNTRGLMSIYTPRD